MSKTITILAAGTLRRIVLAVVVAFITSLTVTQPGNTMQVQRRWSIRFIPNEADSVGVNINNEGWVTWHKSNGEVNWWIPDKWQSHNKIHVYAAASPRGKNASIQVLWDNQNRQTMDFDQDEDHDVERP